MTPSIVVKAKEFNEVIREIGKRTGIELRKIFDSEVQEVVTATINRTKAAKASDIRKFQRKKKNGYNRFFHSPTQHLTLFSFWGELGDTSASGFIKDERFGANGKARRLTWHLNKDLWTRYRAAEKERKAAMKGVDSTTADKLDAVNLSKRTWVSIVAGYNLVIASKVKGYDAVIKAVHKGRSSKTGSTSKIVNEDVYGYRINHTGGFALDKAQGRGAWAYAVNGRVGYAKRNLKAGVFDSVQSTMAAYKNLSKR